MAIIVGINAFLNHYAVTYTSHLLCFYFYYLIHNSLNIYTSDKLIANAEPTFIPLSVAILHCKENTPPNFILFS